jgi:hypothetical protein
MDIFLPAFVLSVASVTPSSSYMKMLKKQKRYKTHLKPFEHKFVVS